MAQVPAPKSPEPATPVQKGASAYGTQYMVVTAHPEATKAGLWILEHGGKAADAAVAVQTVLGLVEPQSSGIGGGGFALYYDAKTKKVHAFDGRETAPKEAGKYLFMGEDGKPMDFYDAAIGGRSAGVPGVLRLLETMHGRFGALVWKDLFTPAISLSEKGFMVTPRLAAMVKLDQDHLMEFTATRLYFFPDGVTPVKAGDRLSNPPYAETLKKIAGGGADAFYNSGIAEDIARAVHEDLQNPGLLSVEDMAGYKAIERKSLCGHYRQYMVCSMGEPSSGGLMLLITLGVLENYDLAGMGPGSIDAWHLMGEASRVAFADRNYYMADPDFVRTPGEKLLDPDYIKTRAALINSASVNPKIMPGVPPGWKEKKTPKQSIYDAPKPPGTSHFSIVDKDGNIVSMTSSVEDSFGNRMYVDGFMLNNQLTDFSFVPEVNGNPVANRVEGGKRPRSTMTPVIVFAPDGKPFLIIGSAGGSAIMGYVLERIIGIIDWKQNLLAALSAPNVINRGKGIEMESSAYWLEDGLRAKGHPVEIKDLNSGLTAILFENGVMTGAADPRREGTAAGN